MTTETWIQRATVEADELEARLERLKQHNPVVPEMDAAQERLLAVQQSLMDGYLEVLRLRLDLADDAT